MDDKFSLFGAVQFSLPAPIEFTESSTKLPGIRSEYHIIRNGVKFHFFGDPDLPEDLGDVIESSLSGYPKGSVFTEYVPEVDSWYAHIKGLSVGLSASLVEGILKKIAVNVKVVP
tara:strand:+ start:175 stop:519 length:345 start_codon:yes stop_codon:yes gene_type:complete